MVRLIFSVWLVSGYAHVFVLFSVVIVTLPLVSDCAIGWQPGKRERERERELWCITVEEVFVRAVLFGSRSEAIIRASCLFRHPAFVLSFPLSLSPQSHSLPVGEHARKGRVSRAKIGGWALRPRLFFRFCKTIKCEIACWKARLRRYVDGKCVMDRMWKKCGSSAVWSILETSTVNLNFNCRQVGEGVMVGERGDKGLKELEGKRWGKGWVERRVR